MDAGTPLAWFSLSAGQSASRIVSALARAGYVAEPPATARYECLFVDTQDGRLTAEGCRLSLRRTAGKTSWHFTNRAEEQEGPYDGDFPVRWLASNFEGVPSAAADLAAGRRFFPLVRVKVFAREFFLRSPSADRIFLCVERALAAPPGAQLPRGRWPLGIVGIRLLEGNPDGLLHLATYLRDRLSLPPAPGDICRTILQALGLPEPGAPIPAHLRVGREDTLAVAGRKIVVRQLANMKANAQGVIEDLDPEYLHDLRVATRRLRSGLRLFATALGPARCASLSAELGWLAGLLGAVRDLDVFRINLRDQAQRLGEAGRIADVLADELGRRRAPEQEALAAALTSHRYATLIRRVEKLAASEAPHSGPGAVRVFEAAPTHLRKAQKRVLKLGRIINPSSPPGDLHRLRILFKRLRYACEFFREAFADPDSGTDPIADYIEAMVLFQDNLGEHQDAVVAVDRIQALAKELIQQGTLSHEHLLDLGALIQIQREIAQARRVRLFKLWRKFDKRAVRKRLIALETRPTEPGTDNAPAGHLELSVG